MYSYLAMSRPLGRVEMFNEIYVFLSCILGKLIMYKSVFLLLSHVYCNCMTKVSLDYFHCISYFFFKSPRAFLHYFCLRDKIAAGLKCC